MLHRFARAAAWAASTRLSSRFSSTRRAICFSSRGGGTQASDLRVQARAFLQGVTPGGSVLRVGGQRKCPGHAGRLQCQQRVDPALIQRMERCTWLFAKRQCITEGRPAFAIMLRVPFGGDDVALQHRLACLALRPAFMDGGNSDPPVLLRHQQQRIGHGAVNQLHQSFRLGN